MLNLFIDSFKIYSLFCITYSNCNANYWSLFCTGIGKETDRRTLKNPLSRVNLLNYNVEQEFLKEREDGSASPLEKKFRTILSENTSNDIAVIRLYDKNYRVLQHRIKITKELLDKDRRIRM